MRGRTQAFAQDRTVARSAALLYQRSADADDRTLLRPSRGVRKAPTASRGSALPADSALHIGNDRREFGTARRIRCKSDRPKAARPEPLPFRGHARPRNLANNTSSLNDLS